MQNRLTPPRTSRMMRSLMIVGLFGLMGTVRGIWAVMGLAGFHVLMHKLMNGLNCFLPAVILTPICLWAKKQRRLSATPLPRLAQNSLLALGAVAVLGMVVGIVGVVGDAFVSAHIVARQSTCLSNEKTMGLALLQYAQDWDETFPPAAHWANGSQPYLPKTFEGMSQEDLAQTLGCPDRRSQYSYALNVNIGSAKIEALTAPVETVGVLEADALTWNAIGSVQSLPPEPRHSVGDMFLLLDGHAKYVNRAYIKTLRWNR